MVVTEPLQASAAPKRGRRVWLRILVSVIALALLAGVTELALRAIIPNVIASSVRQELGLDSTHEIEVTQGGSALWYALTGRVGEVAVTVPDLEVLAGIETTLSARADALPFNPTSGEIVGGVVSATIPSSSMSALVSLATNGLVDTGEVRAGEILVGKTIELFGFEVPLSAALAVGVENGDLLIKPNSLRAVGFDLQAEQLRALLGDGAAELLDAHTVCVRDRLPAGVELLDLDLRGTMLGGSAVVTARLAPDLLSNPLQQQPGSCAAD